MVEKVAELRKLDSAHDIIHKGTIIKLKSEPCGKGIELIYLRAVPDGIPEPFKSMAESSATLTHMHVELTWWDRLLGRTYKSKVDKAVVKLKTNLLRRLEVADAVMGLK